MILGRHIGPALVEALGLPRNTAWFELRCAVDEAVTVKCEYYPAGSDGLATVFAQYQLVHRDGPELQSDHLESFDAWIAMRNDIAHKAFMIESGRQFQFDRAGE